jgi:hypothetical protein
MVKNIVLPVLCICAAVCVYCFIFPSDSKADSSTTSTVINTQIQTQQVTDVDLGIGSASATTQSQVQAGAGFATDTNSFAGDVQFQEELIPNHGMVGSGGGFTNGGNYSYLSGASSIGVVAYIPTVDGNTQMVSGVVGGMGALATANGDSFSAASNALSHSSGFSMQNGADSVLNPMSLNVDGFITY